MRVRKLLKAWSRVVGVPVKKMSFAGNVLHMVKTTNNGIEPAELKSWLIRKCDREDAIDWFPYSIVSNGDLTRVYYANINAESPSHSHGLVLTIHGSSRAMFYEWVGNRIISSRLAVVEEEPSVPKPNGEELTNLLMYAVSTGAAAVDPPTINGKPVR